jgi:prevent-host-death family protein
MAIYYVQMDISVTAFKQRCLEIIRRVEQTGEPVAITRRGRVVARVQRSTSTTAEAATPPWQQLRRLGGHLRAAPGDSVLTEEDFEASR